MRVNILLTSILVLAATFFCDLMAQLQPPERPAELPTLTLPELDNAALLALELQARKPGRAPAFAEVRPVNVRPATNGLWTDNGDGTSTWQMRVISPTAHSLNLGFTEFWMPQGGELYLTTGSKDDWEVLGPFTPADNEAHNQLWTPMIDGDELIVHVNLPTAERENLRLWLTHVNHDFLDFDRQVKSGSCNVDVVCGAADGFPIVDLYRDIIRSVAVYSTGGGTFCTGFLVNNTRNDGTPYFMTANHCGIGAGNAPSLVTYWNFENSTCRAPGGAASGGNGDGALSIFNTGATWRASNPASDMTIVELDDPVNPDADGYLAGWDNTYDVPTDTVIAIHHPSTDEKRISFTFQQTYFTAGFNGSPNPTSGSHLHIPDWDIGTTEPGSSGSPVFDRFHRVRGQLHGGQAACGNDAYDTYGAVSSSWEGGGSPSSRLRDWLDPDDLGFDVMDGRDVNAPQATVNVSPTNQSVCGTDASEYNLVVGGGFAGPVQFSIEDLPAGLNASYSQNPATPGSTVLLTITPAPGTEGAFSFTLAGNNGPDTDEALLRLNVTAAVPEAPSLFAPDNFATNVSLSPTLSWNDLQADEYEYQLATNNTFTEGLMTGTTPGTAFMQPSALEQSTMYFWRTRALNACGTGEWSSLRAFTTLATVCRSGVASTDVPVNIPSAGTPQVFSELTLPEGESIAALEVNVTIEHTFVGDLIISLTSPDGVEVVLMDRIGVPASGFGCSGNDVVLTFTDFAPQPYEDLENSCADLPAASGTYQPLEPLSLFNDEAPNGVWTLTVSDGASQDGGTLTDWSIVPCSAGAMLPVTLGAFTGREDGCDVDLKWTAQREENFQHYELEQSFDGRTFAGVDKIQPRPDGNYTYRVQGANGTRLFRLRMVDLDGSFAYSEVITTSNDCGKVGITALYPNPTAGGAELTAQFDRPLAAGTVLRVFAADGRRVLEQATGSGSQVQTINVRELPSGTYFLRVVTGGEVITKPFVIGQ